MRLLADVDTISANLGPLTSEIEEFSSAVSTFNGASINCTVEEVSGVLDSYKSSIGDDLAKLNNSSNEYNQLVEDCCNEYKANEANVQDIDAQKIIDIITNLTEITSDYKGNAAANPIIFLENFI